MIYRCTQHRLAKTLEHALIWVIAMAPSHHQVRPKYSIHRNPLSPNLQPTFTEALGRRLPLCLGGFGATFVESASMRGRPLTVTSRMCILRSGSAVSLTVISHGLRGAITYTWNIANLCIQKLFHYDYGPRYQGKPPWLRM
jgi:hypothetical protein